MPATGRPAPNISSNGDGSVTIKYVPTQSGVHELNLAYNEQPVTGQCSSIRGWRNGLEEKKLCFLGLTSEFYGFKKFLFSLIV